MTSTTACRVAQALEQLAQGPEHARAQLLRVDVRRRGARPRAGDRRHAAQHREQSGQERRVGAA